MRFAWKYSLPNAHLVFKLSKATNNDKLSFDARIEIYKVPRMVFAYSSDFRLKSESLFLSQWVWFLKKKEEKILFIDFKGVKS